MDHLEAVRALFGRKPEAAPEPEPTPITGPIIPGQEMMPAHQNQSATSAFINTLFNN